MFHRFPCYFYYFFLSSFFCWYSLLLSFYKGNFDYSVSELLNYIHVIILHPQFLSGMIKVHVILIADLDCREQKDFILWDGLVILDHIYVNLVGVYSALCVDSSSACVCVSDTEKHDRPLLWEHQGWMQICQPITSPITVHQVPVSIMLCQWAGQKCHWTPWVTSPRHKSQFLFNTILNVLHLALVETPWRVISVFGFTGW